MFTSHPNANPGIYVEPIYITVNNTIAGNDPSTVLYFVLNLRQKSNVIPNYDMMEELAHGKNLSVSLNIYNPTNTPINNTMMSVEFPSFSTSISSISLTCPQTNKTTSGTDIVLNWLIPYTQPDHSTQCSYSIFNITDLQPLLAPITTIESTFGPSAPIFTFISAEPKNLTFGENSNLTISALYEGTYQPDMTLWLSSNFINVANPYKIITHVNSEQIINATFAIVPNAMMNSTLRLVVTGLNINKSYYIPITISPKPTAVSVLANTLKKDFEYIAAALIAVILALAVLQATTTMLPKKIEIEKGYAFDTTNKLMRRYKYEHVFQLLPKTAEKLYKIELKEVPTRWGILTPINKRNVRIVNISNHLTIYTRGVATSSVKRHLERSNIDFVELAVE